VKVTLIATGFEEEQRQVAAVQPAARVPMREESRFIDGRRPQTPPSTNNGSITAPTSEPKRETPMSANPLDAQSRDNRPPVSPTGTSGSSTTRQPSQPLVTSSGRTGRTSQPLRNLPSAKDVDLPTFVRSRIDKDRSGN